MDDPSVNVSSLTRQEILAQLNLTNSHQNVNQLRGQLRKQIMKKHPINSYLDSLKKGDIQDIYLKLSENPTIKHFDRIKKFIADQFFDKCAKAPLASLVWFIEVGRLPDQAGVNLLYEHNLELCHPSNKSHHMAENLNEEHAKNCINENNSKQDIIRENAKNCNNENNSKQDINENTPIKDINENNSKQGINEKNANFCMNEENYNEGNKEECAKNYMNQDETARGMNHNNLNDNTNGEAILPPYSGRKFKNQRNDCYINATMNLLLSSNAIREGVIESFCHCPLCKYLLKVINDPSYGTKHGASEVKSWASSFKPIFGGTNQQDAEEFLHLLVKECENLQGITGFDTAQWRICNTENCNEVTFRIQETGRIISCPIEVGSYDLNNTNSMVQKNDFTIQMHCTQCKMNAGESGPEHTVAEFFTALPKVLLVSAKRFTYDTQGRKITSDIYPSPILSVEENGHERSFYLKSVVQHHGLSVESGHYTTALNMNGRWLICNDTRNFNVTSTDPLDGYIFLYEDTPLNVPQVVHDTPIPQEIFSSLPKKTTPTG